MNYYVAIYNVNQCNFQDSTAPMFIVSFMTLVSFETTSTYIRLPDNAKQS